MAATVHRKDMSAADFMLLARFSRLICCYSQDKVQLNFGFVYSLGLVRMLLPVWYRTGSIWRLDRYREFVQEAIGVEVKTLRGMCRYLQVSESVLVGTLYRFSMLAVVPRQKNYERPKFRMPIVGDVLGIEGIAEPIECSAFVIEKRRATGAFK